MSTKQHDETEVCDAGFTAADMATAAAQGFRDGQASQAAAMRAGGEPVAWRVAVLDLIDDCPGLSMEQDHWLSRRVKELDFISAHPKPAAQDAERRPLTDGQIDQAIAELGLNYLVTAHATNRSVLRKLCHQAHAIAAQQGEKS